ncbi:hypothetical protein L1987_28911 [Smallanthus sonchifolius]|uniref:Uncharacterized protein n=1 Tax=Smallanthus sonchifolius TaxID=185202 RepID=A0ACB9HY04_9ASTR|nr:hypothetical protein L1987_28911 [Smallanthus sonchifolius]
MLHKVYFLMIRCNWDVQRRSLNNFTFVVSIVHRIICALFYMSCVNACSMFNIALDVPNNKVDTHWKII